MIGKGTSGNVFLVQDEKNQRLCVEKTINLAGKTEPELVQVLSEVKFLQVLKHPNIISFFGSKRQGDQLRMFLEYANQGTLQEHIDRLREKGKRFSEEKLLEIFTQLLLGLKFSHDHQIIHRDLKTDNIFIKGNTVKIADFGVSKLIRN